MTIRMPIWRAGRQTPEKTTRLYLGGSEPPRSKEEARLRARRRDLERKRREIRDAIREVERELRALDREVP